MLSVVLPPQNHSRVVEGGQLVHFRGEHWRGTRAPDRTPVIDGPLLRLTAYPDLRVFRRHCTGVHDRRRIGGVFMAVVRDGDVGLFFVLVRFEGYEAGEFLRSGLCDTCFEVRRGAPRITRAPVVPLVLDNALVRPSRRSEYGIVEGGGEKLGVLPGARIGRSRDRCFVLIP